MPEPTASARLATALPTRRRLARRIVELASCLSTQDEAREAGAPAGTLWFAHEQRAGRGRTARDWWSGAAGENLAISLSIAPALQPPPLTLVAAACALAASLERFGAGSAAVKWPNDVLLRGNKVAGLIGEWLDGSPPRVLLGAGVNVASAPPALAARRPTTSVQAELAARGLPAADRHALLADWLLGLERRLDRTVRRGSAELEEEFLMRLRLWAPWGVREANGQGGGRLLEFRFASGLAWESEGRILRRHLALITDLEALQ